MLEKRDEGIPDLVEKNQCRWPEMAAREQPRCLVQRHGHTYSVLGLDVPSAARLRQQPSKSLSCHRREGRVLASRGGAKRLSPHPPSFRGWVGGMAGPILLRCMRGAGAAAGTGLCMQRPRARGQVGRYTAVGANLGQARPLLSDKQVWF